MFKERITEDEERERDLALKVRGDGFGGTRGFSGADAATMRRMIDRGFADPGDRQNEAPTLGELTEYCARTPGATMGGYVVSRDREDCRVSVDSVEVGRPMDPAELEEFEDLFYQADEFEANPQGAMAWWD